MVGRDGDVVNENGEGHFDGVVGGDGRVGLEGRVANHGAAEQRRVMTGLLWQGYRAGIGRAAGICFQRAAHLDHGVVDPALAAELIPEGHHLVCAPVDLGVRGCRSGQRAVRMQPQWRRR